MKKFLLKKCYNLDPLETKFTLEVPLPTGKICCDFLHDFANTVLNTITEHLLWLPDIFGNYYGIRSSYPYDNLLEFDVIRLFYNNILKRNRGKYPLFSEYLPVNFSISFQLIDHNEAIIVTSESKQWKLKGLVTGELSVDRPNIESEIRQFITDTCNAFQKNLREVCHPLDLHCLENLKLLKVTIKILEMKRYPVENETDS